MPSPSSDPTVPGAPQAGLAAHPARFDAITRATWDRLHAATPAATPFSRWTFHRAWWDAYGATAHEQYLVCRPTGRPDDEGGGGIAAVVPLMHRHEVEPQDAATATILRRRHGPGITVPADAKAVFMAASYHADYATVLAPADAMPAVADAVVAALGGVPDPAHGDQPWDVVDLRRLRANDPFVPALSAAIEDGAASRGWQLRREVEDVCPVATLPEGGWDDYLATLDKKARHEIRRKIRRAETVGPVRFELAPLTAASVEAFVELHQARWGADGLFPPTEGGERSRRFLHRLTELEAAEGDLAQLQLGQVRVGDRLIFATVGFDDGSTCYFYNAGMDPDAREMSPGVTGTGAYLRDRQAAGRRRFDFLRGNEAYKYEWGAVDEPVHRLLVTRAACEDE
jgi:CelD/BcsL family acetyltransferase involved in cellulose biosynthesis